MTNILKQVCKIELKTCTDFQTTAIRKFAINGVFKLNVFTLFIVKVKLLLSAGMDE